LNSASFHDLPPAYIMACELDSLLIDSQTYAERLRNQNIPVNLTIEEGLIHSSVRARGVCPKASEAWKRFCDHVVKFA